MGFGFAFFFGTQPNNANIKLGCRPDKGFSFDGTVLSLNFHDLKEEKKYRFFFFLSLYFFYLSIKMDPDTLNTLYQNSFTRMLSEDTLLDSDEDLMIPNLDIMTGPLEMTSALESEQPIDNETSQSPAVREDGSTQSPRKRQKVSAVWTYFTLTEDGLSARCLICMEHDR